MRLIAHGFEAEATVDAIAALYTLADTMEDLSRRARMLRAPEAVEGWRVERRGEKGGAS